MQKLHRDFDRREFLQFSGHAVGVLAVCGGSVALADSPDGRSEKSNLIVHQEVPHNAEPALQNLVKSWLTPTDQFYVRSHAPVPKIDPDSFRLAVEGLVDKPIKVSLHQLQKQFAKQTVVATMTCAGNRRSEHSLIHPVKGVPWGAGAIGNAEWGGVLLSDLLKKAGVKDAARHVCFEGVDEIERESGVIPFGGSIPLKTAIGDSKQMPGALVCYEMNGKELTPDHGFPMRTVVPGYIGARSVKWLGKIIVSDQPSTNHYVANAYKVVTEGTNEEWRDAQPIYEFPMNSVTCTPVTSDKLQPGELTIRGYALAPGNSNRTIAKVEVSSDGGKNWKKAEFTKPAQPFCWRIWTVKMKLPIGKHELIVRAMDSAGDLQAEKTEWNLKGYLFNAWHRTQIEVATK